MNREKMKSTQSVPKNPVIMFHSCACVKQTVLNKQGFTVSEGTTSPLLKSKMGYVCSACGKSTIQPKV